MHKYANAAKRKRYATIASVVGIAVMIPAIFTFLRVFNENQIQTQFQNFVNTEVREIPDFQLIGEPDINIDKSEIKFSFFNEVTDVTKNLLSNQLKNNINYAKIKDFKILIKGSDTKSFELITTAYKEKREELQKSKNIIDGLQREIADLQTTISTLNNRIEQDALNKNEKVIAFSRIAKEAKIRYADIEEIGFASVLSSKDFIKIDTVPVATIRWNIKLPDSIISPKERELRTWLQKEMKLDTLFIKRD